MTRNTYWSEGSWLTTTVGPPSSDFGIFLAFATRWEMLRNVDFWIFLTSATLTHMRRVHKYRVLSFISKGLVGHSLKRVWNVHMAGSKTKSRHEFFRKCLVFRKFLSDNPPKKFHWELWRAMNIIYRDLEYWKTQPMGAFVPCFTEEYGCVNSCSSTTTTGGWSWE